MRTWFSPWNRIVEDRGEKWNLEDLAGYLIIGLISRILGFILRTIIITLGLICLFIVVTLGLVIYIFWLITPLLLIVLLGFGISLLVAQIYI
jgi:CHASE2 domain-containing sensor protein